MDPQYWEAEIAWREARTAYYTQMQLSPQDDIIHQKDVLPEISGKIEYPKLRKPKSAPPCVFVPWESKEMLDSL